MTNQIAKEIIKPSSGTESVENTQLGEILISPLGFLSFLSIAILIWTSLGKSSISNSRRNKTARGRWGGKKEKSAARRMACKQIRKRQYNKSALFIAPKEIPKPVVTEEEYLVNIPPSPDILFVPDANRGIFVGGANGSGKSYSFINPLLRSSFDQGFPVILYDHKYNLGNKSQTARVAGYAIERGYEVLVFAPGYKESCTINPLDFLDHKLDSTNATQLAITVNANSRLAASNNSKGDSFFTEAADMLAQGLFLAAKDSKYSDILMAFAILVLDKLAQRLAVADEANPNLPTSFKQLISVKDSQKTSSSITASALNLFNRFVDWEILPVFCGKTDLPLQLNGRRLIIFGCDEEKRDVITPLMAGIMQLLITKNLSRQRTSPLVCCLDEFPTIYLPSLARWLNEKREQGFIGILGLQNYSQLEEKYGKDTANIIFAGCMTKAFFSVGSEMTAEKFSKYLGDEEVTNINKQKTTGGKGGSSTNTSLDVKTRPLFEVGQFNTLPQGQAVIISPGFQSRGQANLPILEKIKLSSGIDDLENRSVQIWNEYKKELIKKASERQITGRDLELRIQEAKRMFPLPGEDVNMGY